MMRISERCTSRRSPDAAQRNPGFGLGVVSRVSLSLHPGYLKVGLIGYGPKLSTVTSQAALRALNGPSSNFLWRQTQAWVSTSWKIRLLLPAV